MSEAIASQICSDLKERPVDWLTEKTLGELCKRGNFSLVLVSDRKIREINKQWRHKDAATDVLSFPLDLEPPPPPVPYEVGEIIVSLDRARDQADQYGHSFDRELAFLISHGILHVLGFDHENLEDETEMFGRQKRILDLLGYIRD